VGIDQDGTLAALYKIASCPQTTFVLPGGTAEGEALLSQPSASLLRSRGITFPVGIDQDGTLAALYKIASCPQTTFVLPGGTAEGEALLSLPSASLLRSRVEGLVAAAKAGGWREPKR
jgi:hypothetical protein